MKQKKESKITTVCSLVAVYNDMLTDKNLSIGVSIAYNIGVRLSVGKGINKRAVYTGELGGAISFIAVRLFDLCDLPHVHGWCFDYGYSQL